MTISDAINELFKYYFENDSYEMDRDFHNLILISESPEEHKASILCALEKLKETGIVKSQTYENKTYYILDKSLDSYEQTVTIHGNIAKDIAAEINKACEIIGDTSDYCDSTEITEADIANLINVIKLYERNNENKV
jgi:hypothetical protein